MLELPNINIGQVYDSRYSQADIHYDRLENLAGFFGRSMPVHYHDRFFQLHIILDGMVRVSLGETSYRQCGPLYFFTPPTVPHAFATEPSACGHVLTIRQELVWQLSQEERIPPGAEQNPLCIELKRENRRHQRMLQSIELFASEWAAQDESEGLAMRTILQLLLQDALAGSQAAAEPVPSRSNDLRLFNEFNRLLDSQFRAHLPLADYASQLGLTEARLNTLCRRYSGLSPKQLLSDRLLSEAKRLLLFTGTPITEIAYNLGFKDPGYFSRFFRSGAGVTAREFRLRGGALIPEEARDPL